jgi:hypothetical protein
LDLTDVTNFHIWDNPSPSAELLDFFVILEVWFNPVPDEANEDHGLVTEEHGLTLTERMAGVNKGLARKLKIPKGYGLELVAVT